MTASGNITKPVALRRTSVVQFHQTGLMRMLRRAAPETAAPIGKLRMGKLSETDAAGVFEFWTDLYRESDVTKNFVTIAMPEPDKIAAETTRLVLEEDGGLAVTRVAHDGGRIVGFAYVSTYNSRFGDPELSIHVRSGYRYSGLGTALMDGLLDASRGIFDGINLFVAPDNVVAKGLYRKFGFKKTEMHSQSGNEMMSLDFRNPGAESWL